MFSNARYMRKEGKLQLHKTQYKGRKGSKCQYTQVSHMTKSQSQYRDVFSIAREQSAGYTDGMLEQLFASMDLMSPSVVTVDE